MTIRRDMIDALGVYYDGPLPPFPMKGKMDDIALTLSKLTIDELYQLGTTLHTGMVANVATFATPNPTSTAFDTALSDAQTGNNAYEAGKVTLTNLLNTRDAKNEALKGMIRQWMNYVMNTTNDATKWQAVGFTLKGQAVPLGPLGQVLNLVVTAGDNEGTLDVSWDALRGAQSYEVQTSSEPVTGTSWAAKMTAAKSSATIIGLTSGARIWVRVRGVGAKNVPGVWSDPAVKTVP
jgi:hypothetical protein